MRTCATDDAAVRTESFAPERVRQHDLLASARGCGRPSIAKKRPRRRHHFHAGKRVAADERDPRALGFGVSQRERGSQLRFGEDLREAVGLPPELVEAAERERRVVPIVEPNQFVRPRRAHRLDEQRVRGGEHGRIDADAKSDRDDRGEREAGGGNQPPDGDAKVVPEIRHAGHAVQLVCHHPSALRVSELTGHRIERKRSVAGLGVRNWAVR